MAAKTKMVSVESTANKFVIKIKLLVSPSVPSMTVAATGTDAETVVTVVATMTVLLTELSKAMRAVLVSVGVAVLVVGRPSGAIRVIVAAVASVLLPLSSLVWVEGVVVLSGTAMTALTLSANLQASEGASRVGEPIEVSAAIKMESITEHKAMMVSIAVGAWPLMAEGGSRGCDDRCSGKLVEHISFLSVFDY